MEFMFKTFLEALGALTLLVIVTYLIIVFVMWITKINDSFQEIEKMNNELVKMNMKIKRLENERRL